MTRTTERNEKISRDSSRPHRLTEEGQSALVQARALLTVLSELTGQAAIDFHAGTPPMSIGDLHLALWGVESLVSIAARETGDEGA